MTDKEKIKSEFEKRSILCKKARIDLRKDINIAYYEGQETAYKEAVLYIDSLQKESVSEDLEEAAFDYAESCKYEGGDKLLCVEHFKAGAKWGMNQAMAEIQAQSMALAHGCPKEPVNEDLEEAAIRASMLKNDIPKEHLHEYLYNDYGMRKFVEGAKWQEEKDNEEKVLTYKHGFDNCKEHIKEVLLSEVLPCFMHGGEADEVVAKLDEVLN